MRNPTKYIVSLALLTFLMSYQTFSQNDIATNQHSICNPPEFESLTIVDGLPENSVGSILQDYLGYLWIGTQNGLVRYDGYTMKVFQLEKDGSNSLSTMDLTIYEDKNRTLWIGALGGLYKFDRATESFKIFSSSPDDTTTVNSNLIRSFYEDNAGRFWVGTQEGLNLFEVDNEIFSRFDFRNISSSGISVQDKLPVNTIIEDPLTGNLLIGTELNGVWRFSVSKKSFSKYSADNLDKKIGHVQKFHKGRDGKIWIASENTLSRLVPLQKSFEFYINFPTTGDEQNIIFTNPIGSVVEDLNGLVWCGFFKGEQGIFCLDPATGILKQYNLFPDKPKQARYNKILSLYVDHSGIIWIGTWLSGLKKLDKSKNQFQILSSNPNLLHNSLSHSLVYSVNYDPNGYIWFCTQNALDKFDLKNNTFEHYLNEEKCISGFAYTGFLDRSGYLWLGTSNCGLIRFDTRNKSYRFYLNNPNEPVNLLNKQITTVIEDKSGILWIGTNGYGLYKFDVKNDKVTIYNNDPNDSTSLSNDQVLEIFEDSFGKLWIGTNLAGLNRFDRASEKFIRCGFVCISTLFEDKNGNFWVGDFWQGLNLFDREKGVIIKNYSKDDGLLNLNIIGIMEDDHNNLWIASEIGLSKLNLLTGRFRNYTNEDGLPEWLTSESFCFKDPSGKMYINTNEGQIVFHPDSIRDDSVPPQLVLSKLSLFNRPDEKLNYDGFISEIKEITVPYDQNDLKFDFVGLHYSAPEKNKYKYILENFDKDWVDAGNQISATYTNLSPGEYIFKVTASNKDGVWNKEGATIKIIILPPWWLTTWAYILYLLFIGTAVSIIWKTQLKRIKVKHEFEMSRFEAQKLHEVDELKSRFFTNISHEFRTPLTLILGPAKQLIEKIKDEKIKSEISMIHRNARKLLGLVNQLLDISKLESGNMKLRTSPQNIVSLLKALLLSFTSYAERKRITLNFNSVENEIIVYLDKEKFEKIITNILSNAFKFTADGGRIEVTCHPEFISGSAIVSESTNDIKKLKQVQLDNQKFVKITISDTGIGIPKEKMSKIFDRFYQVDGSHTREQEGTGIGLSLTKELVELHKGKIEVESEEGKGATFTVNIPLGTEHLKPEEISKAEEVYACPSDSTSAREKEKQDYYEETENITEQKIGKEFLGKEELPLLLIVEDNSDVRSYIKDNLKENYRALEAVDGEDGWDEAIEQIPDLIVSDVMMPKMDGFKLCEKLKTDSRTSHIPVILLTAKAAKEDKLEGYETGADDYIMKPFDTDELKARIKNLLEQRKRLHEHFQKEGIFKLDETRITSVDKKFLQKAYDIISHNISNVSFSVEMFAENLSVSKSLLHKKIVGLTGEPPVEFIRRIRLNKAAKLIENKFGNLSEIALEVGFNNPSYFAECFKKQFGVTPSQYHRNNKTST